MEARLVVITGVTRGLGRALAERIAAEGHAVAGCGRDAKAIGALAEELPGHHFSVVDVTDASAVDAWTDAVLSSRGAPDLVVNNAALINRSAPLWSVPVDEFSAVVDVNIKGVYHVARAFLPAMIARGRGVVANFSSGWGRSTSPEVAPYCATKWAIEGMTAAMAQELPRGVAAIAVNPGIIDTSMLRSAFGAGAASHEKPAQWAERAAPFLLSLDASDNGGALSI